MDNVYCADLKINETTEAKDHVNYLGMTISTQERRFYTCIYDKRKLFPFKVIRYPDATSLLPKQMALNVFISQLHRIYQISSLCKDFLKASLEMVHTFLQKGYPKHALSRLFQRFIRRPGLRYPTVNARLLINRFRSKLLV
jgi:hypothetical protein